MVRKAKFGSLIRDFRNRKGWTQSELAQALGYENPQFISLLERDLSKTPLYVLGQLIVILGIPEAEVTHRLLSSYESDVKQELLKGKKIARRTVG